MVVYRANDSDAAYLLQILKQHELPAEVERFGTVSYVSIASDHADIPRLARSAGESVREVLTLDQLAAQQGRTA